MNVRHSKTCPHCGAVDALVVDYQRGEVACSSCAIVCEGGLLEDSQTAFDEDGIGVSEDRARVELARIDRATASARRDRLRDLLTALQGRTSMPDVAVDAALAYANAYNAKMLASNRPRMDPSLLAATSLYISGVIRRVPVQPHEFAALRSVLKDVTVSKIDAARMKVLSELPDVAAEYTVMIRAPFPDIIALYGRRFRPLLTPDQCAVAVAIAEAYHSAAESPAPSVASMAMLALYLMLTEPRARSLWSGATSGHRLSETECAQQRTAVAAACRLTIEDLNHLNARLSAQKRAALMAVADQQCSTLRGKRGREEHEEGGETTLPARHVQPRQADRPT